MLRRNAFRRRWRMVPSIWRWRMSAWLASSSQSTLQIKLLHLSMHQILLFTLLWILKVLVIFFVHLWVRGRKRRIDVLWSGLMLGSLKLFLTVEKSLLKRAILIKRAAHKVGRVRQTLLFCPIADLNRRRTPAVTRTAMSAALRKLSRASRGIRGRNR